VLVTIFLYFLLRHGEDWVGPVLLVQRCRHFAEPNQSRFDRMCRMRQIEPFIVRAGAGKSTSAVALQIARLLFLIPLLA
jgi:hypothetical protein